MEEKEKINNTIANENDTKEFAEADMKKKKKRKNRIKNFFSEFKKFIGKRNVIDLAVGVIIGGAFTAVVTGLTTHIFQPLINALLSLIGGNNALESARTILRRTPETGEIDWASSIYIDWGAFISTIINFILIALILFLIVKIINTIADKKARIEEQIKEEYYKKHPEEKPVEQQKTETELEVLSQIRDYLKSKEEKK